MMSEVDFDRRLAAIDQGHAGKREVADAWRDQELARLFTECGWTQEKIAARMGKRQAWVSKRLAFGRFLNFIPNGIIPESLTEGRFRSVWVRTEGKEVERFEQALKMLTGDVPPGFQRLQKKPGIRAAILKHCSDGDWYTVSEIQASVEEELQIEIACSDSIHNQLNQFKISPPPGLLLESKKVGKKSQYRLRKSSSQIKEVNRSKVLDLYEQTKPLIDELRHWGQSSKFNIPPSALAQIAQKLERLFDAVLESKSSQCG